MVDIVWLSVVQGITEFLPISSSGHLFVVSTLFHLSSLGRTVEVTLNSATLLVVVVYFRKDILGFFLSFWKLFLGKISQTTYLLFKICFATLPVIVVGYFVHRFFDHQTHSLVLFGWVSILFGLLMILADHLSPFSKTYSRITYRDAFLIGCAITLSFIPGASRLGTSLTMARALGYKTYDAAKFSFLSSLPTGIGAMVLTTYTLPRDSFFQIGFETVATLALSFCTGFFTLHFFMKWTSGRSLLLWGLYRICLGLFILCYFGTVVP